MASHAKVNKFALYLKALFALKSVQSYRNVHGLMVYKFKGTKDALTRLVKYIGVVDGLTKKEISNALLYIDPPSNKTNKYSLCIELDSRKILENIEQNLHIKKDDMKRAIDALVDAESR